MAFHISVGSPGSYKTTTMVFEVVSEIEKRIRTGQPVHLIHNIRGLEESKLKEYLVSERKVNQSLIDSTPIDIISTFKAHGEWLRKMEEYTEQCASNQLDLSFLNEPLKFLDQREREKTFREPYDSKNGRFTDEVLLPGLYPLFFFVPLLKPNTLICLDEIQMIYPRLNRIDTGKALTFSIYSIYERFIKLVNLAHGIPIDSEGLENTFKDFLESHLGNCPDNWSNFTILNLWETQRHYGLEFYATCQNLQQVHPDSRRTAETISEHLRAGAVIGINKVYYVPHSRLVNGTFKRYAGGLKIVGSKTKAIWKLYQSTVDVVDVTKANTTKASVFGWYFKLLIIVTIMGGYSIYKILFEGFDSMTTKDTKPTNQPSVPLGPNTQPSSTTQTMTAKLAPPPSPPCNDEELIGYVLLTESDSIWTEPYLAQVGEKRYFKIFFKNENSGIYKIQDDIEQVERFFKTVRLNTPCSLILTSKDCLQPTNLPVIRIIGCQEENEWKPNEPMLPKITKFSTDTVNTAIK